MTTTFPYSGEDFCLTHGMEYMRRQMGNPIPFCEACDIERETGREVKYEDCLNCHCRPEEQCGNKF